MLSMEILYDTLKKNGSGIKLDRMEFLAALLPKDKNAAQELYRLLLGQDSYKSNFFKGKLGARGLATPVRDVLDALAADGDDWMNQVTARCTSLLERNHICFANCLEEWNTHIREEQVLQNYISLREGKPEHDADILAVLFLYCLTLWKRDRYLEFLAGRYQNGMSDGWSFALDRAEFYASCGGEATIFETSIIEGNGVEWLDVKMKFAPTRIRKEVPQWASIVFKMNPPRDIRYFHSFLFRMEPVAGDSEPDCGLKQLVVEIHGADKNVPYDYHTVAMECPLGMDPLQGKNPDLLKQAAEFCFVVNQRDLYRLEEDNPDVLGCHFRIAQLRLN